LRPFYVTAEHEYYKKQKYLCLDSIKISQVFMNWIKEVYTMYDVSSPVFSGVRVTRSLILCACFVDRCLSFCTFFFGHCVVCSSAIYGFLLLLWYLQTLLKQWWSTIPSISRKRTVNCKWYFIFALNKMIWTRRSHGWNKCNTITN
jgi:hypothetical protein